MSLSYVYAADRKARHMWTSSVYDRIPKSVFAQVAWHLGAAALADSTCPESRFLSEADRLLSEGAITSQQHARIERPLLKRIHQIKEERRNGS